MLLDWAWMTLLIVRGLARSGSLMMASPKSSGKSSPYPKRIY
jgi:hypothetical protein